MFYIDLPIDNFNQWNVKKLLLQKVYDLCKSKKYSVQQLEKLLSEAYNEQIELFNLNEFISKQNGQSVIEFWEKILPFICNQAQKIEQLFQKKRIKILKQQSEDYNILTKGEICSLLANMFFFTIEKQIYYQDSIKSQTQSTCQSQQTEKKHFQLPNYVNMKNILTRVDGLLENQCNIQKIYCIINYFKRLMTSTEFEQQLNVIYQRRSLSNQSIFDDIKNQIYQANLNKIFLQPILIDEESSIQTYEDKFECIQCDFADKYVGGGVLNKGCVQEEIMFIVSPELIPSILFCERLADNEVVQVSGCERYCTYKGYGASFEYDNNYISQIEVDQAMQIKLAHYTIYDATNFRNRESDQYLWQYVLRDLQKAYVAFNHVADRPNYSLFQNFYNRQIQFMHEQQKDIQAFIACSKNLPVITGNWGCGLYRGDVQLKLFIQWISASLNNKKVIYCTFGNPLLKNAQQIITAFQGKPLDHVIKLLQNFLPLHDEQELFEYLLKNIN
ncbi:hypothetical protein ABPG73_011892 [Tetrahymena malaccensis]